MNAVTSHIMQRTIYTLACAVSLTFIPQADTAAHTVDYRPGFVEVHYGYARARQFPGWLRRDREFQHWYWHSRYRFKRHLNWHRLYHMYLNDRRQHWHARRLLRHHHVDHGYRAYNKKHRKRDH